MIYAYLRVSTEDQNTKNQKHEIRQFAKSKDLNGRIRWTEETVSGTKSYEERKLGDLLEQLKMGDIIITTELSRFGRSLFEVMTILHLLMKKKAIVYCIKEGFELKDDLNSQVLAFAFSLAAQIERQLISQRTKEALGRVKAEGKRLGRPPGTTSINKKLQEKHEEIVQLYKKGVSQSALARIFGVNRNTMSKYIKDQKIVKK